MTVYHLGSERGLRGGDDGLFKNWASLKRVPEKRRVRRLAIEGVDTHSSLVTSKARFLQAKTTLARFASGIVVTTWPLENAYL